MPVKLQLDWRFTGLNINPTRVPYRRPFMVYDVAESFVSMFTGITTALVRMILAIAMAVITLPRLDRSAFPAWVSRYLNLDTGLQSYRGVIVQCHTFNNPVAVVFVALLLEAVRKKKQAASGGSQGGLTSEDLADGLASGPSYGGLSLSDGLLTVSVVPRSTVGVDAAGQAADAGTLPSESPPETVKHMQSARARMTPRRRAVAFRFQLAVLLLRMPQLRQYRDLLPTPLPSANVPAHGDVALVEL